MYKISKIRPIEALPIFLIMTVAAILRFWSFGSLPFMYDEFSALLRTHYDSFGDLILQGVMENDSHPAGVQVFLFYWVKFVGYREFWVKLPFALSGLASVWFTYHIGKKWFSKTSGLIAASLLAVMQFFVFYSQLARPYTAGLFTTLLLAYFWSLIIKRAQVKLAVWIAFTLSLWLTSLMHAFSLFMAGLVYISAFPVLEKQKRKPYLISAFVAVILYLPHLPVFWHQLVKDGTIGGWLAPPSSSFLIDMLRYGFHFSPLFLGISVSIIILVYALNGRFQHIPKQIFFRLCALGWFFITFGIAYLYSVFRSPIIQYSTLYFAAPFLLLAFASFTGNLNAKWNLAIVIPLLTVGSFSLIIDRQHYDLMYNQGFDGLALEVSMDKQLYGDNVLVAARSARPEMPAFYLARQDINDAVLYSRDDHPRQFYNHLDSLHHKHSHLAFAWLDHAPLEWVSAAMDFYPHLIRKKTWFNSEYLLLAKEWSAANNQDFFGKEPNHNYPTKTVEYFGPELKYGSLFESKPEGFIKEGHDLLFIAAEIKAVDLTRNVKLVFEVVESESRKVLHWQAGEMFVETLHPGQTHRLHTTARLRSLDLPLGIPLQFRAYIWNPDAGHFIKNELRITSMQQNSRIFGLFEQL